MSDALVPLSARRICFVTYKFGGNGPWNYFVERPPEGVKLIHAVGVYLGEDERHWKIASDWMTLETGEVLPIRAVNFGKDSCELVFL